MRADLRADPVTVESRTSVLGRNRESARRMVGQQDELGGKWAAMDVGEDVGNDLRQEVEILHQLCYSIVLQVVVVVVVDAVRVKFECGCIVAG